MINKNDLLNELIDKQKKDVHYSKKLSYYDLNRIVKYIDKSIFEKECCIWNGYISKSINNKNYYINFFFKNKKTSLQKLLYENYVGHLNNREYIKYTCDNGGKCCNINHLVKYIPISDSNLDDINNNSNKINNNSNKINLDTIIDKKSDFVVTF